jgi:hypothetical protein
MIAAAREMREWAAGLIAQYTNAVNQAAPPLPNDISKHLNTLHGRLAQADAQLRFGIDLAGQISQGEVSPELHEEAEKSLWDALERFFLLNQAVALPGVLRSGQPQTTLSHRTTHSKTYHDRRIRPDDLWRIAAPSARSELRGTRFGTKEMEEMCEKMGGTLSAGAQQYLDEVEAACAKGDVSHILAMANCPFEPLYRSRRSLDIAGAHVPADYEFHWNFHRGHVEFQKRFSRVPSWEECKE